jgi:hypothetical protein
MDAFGRRKLPISIHFLVFINQFSHEGDGDIDQYLRVVIILHDLQYENLVVAQALVVEVDEVPEEIE